MNKKFKQKVPHIVGKLILMSPDSLKRKIDKDEKAEIVVDDEKFEITKDDVFFEEELKSGWFCADFENGKVYVDTIADDELLAEGFMREIVRRVQDLRKRSGLQKTDRAEVLLRSDAELIGDIAKFKGEMEKRTGSRMKLDVGTTTDMDNNDILKVRERTIAIGLKKR
jgi:isoleucyl-tRNA synthetase